MDCWPINHFSTLSQGEMIGYGNRLSMRNQEAVIGSPERCPAAYTRRCAGTVEVNGCITAESMALPSLGPVSFMTAAPQLRRLKTLACETIHRPGVYEFVRFLAFLPSLSVPFSDMDGPDIQLEGQLRPLVASWRFCHLRIGLR